jgi:hypothetical protein
LPITLDKDCTYDEREKDNKTTIGGFYTWLMVTVSEAVLH